MLGFMAGFVLGGLWWWSWFTVRGWVRKPYKYKYVCSEPNCEISGSSDDPDMIKELALQHKKVHDNSFMSDRTAMETITHIMSTYEWNADTADSVAHIINSTGRSLTESTS